MGPKLVADLIQIIPGNSEMAQRMRALDWAATPLGAPQAWPQSLRTAVRIMLTSRYAMWMGWGDELTFLYNDAYARMTLGAKHPWALGRPAEQVWSEIWRDIGPLVDQVLQTAEATWSEGLLLLLERSGYLEETYHTFSYSPLSDDTGATVGMLCVVTEETERVIGERRLATLAQLAAQVSSCRNEREVCTATEQSLLAAQRDLPFAAVCLFDANGNCKPAALAGLAPDHRLADFGTSGFWHEHISGRPTEQKVFPLAELGAEDLPTGAWRQPPGHVALVAIPGQADDPPAGYLVAAINPFRAYDESYASFLSLIAGQISARLASAWAYEEEKKRAQALAEIDRAKTAFFSNVSHEFRTPLTLMISPIEELIEAEEDLPPHARNLLDIAHRNSSRLLKLVNSLLDFTRIEAGRANARFEPVDLAALTRDLASNFRTATDKAGLGLKLGCHPLPRVVHVDRDMWEKIILNLLSNAFKFTLDGEIAIELGSSPDGKRAVVHVRDTGVGIPANQLPRVFERFHRIEGQPSRSFEGSGIGLALVQELVRLHGGDISVTSEVGKGTTFSVSIPYGDAHLSKDLIAEPAQSASTSVRAGSFVEEAVRWLPGSASIPRPPVEEAGEQPHDLWHRRPRILVVDDNADMRAYLERLLSPYWDVETAANGELALAAVTENLPDLVLTDAMMPLLDGFGLIKRLRADERTKSLPILLLSARAGEEARIDGLQSGADDYLTKPFSSRELVARISANLKLAEVRRQGEARVEGILESITDGFHLIDAEGRFTAFNAAAKLMFAANGVDTSDLIGADLLNEAFPEARDNEIGQAIRTALTERRPTTAESYYRPWKRWFSTRNYPTPDGGVATFFQDITERKQVEQQQRLLTNELNHRVKNTIAIIQSIANQTLRDSASPEAFQTTFSQRLMALARAHNLLTNRAWSGANLRDIVDAALAPFQQRLRKSRIDVSGPHYQLASNLAVSMILAMHELATNAVKYGALSNDTGQVTLAWEIDTTSRQIVLTWAEQGGPPVQEPTRRGFGRRLIEATAEQLGGDIQLVFPTDGVVCRIRFPLSANDVLSDDQDAIGTVGEEKAVPAG